MGCAMPAALALATLFVTPFFAAVRAKAWRSVHEPAVELLPASLRMMASDLLFSRPLGRKQTLQRSV